jgi:hypothetical protein
MSGSLAHNSAEEPGRFFGRQIEIAWLAEQLEQSARILVIHGPPAVGKTALLRKLKRYWTQEVVASSYVPIYLNVSQVADWAAASPLLQVAAEVGRSLRAQMNVDLPPPEATDFAAGPTAAWRAYLEACAARLRDRQMLFLVDGIDRALDRTPADAQAWLRALLDTPVPTVLTTANVSSMAPVLPASSPEPPDLALGPLDHEAAEALLKATLGGGLQIDPWATRRVLEITSHNPLYLRRVGEALQECCTIKTILMQPDVDTALEMLLDRGLPEFSATWRDLTSQEQFVLASLGALRGTRGAATQYDVRSVCDQYGYSLSWDDILAALDGLSERGILEKLGSNNYRFSLELFRLWVHRHRPPEYALRDGLWRSGRSMAAYQVSKVKRTLAQRPRLLMTAGAVLLVVVLVALQPVFWRGRWPAALQRTPQPVAETVAPMATDRASRTRTIESTSTGTASDLTPQAAPVLPGYDVVCMSRTGEDEPWQILALNPLSGETVAITQTRSNERTPRWSPDGHRLAFVSDRDGEREVYVMDLAQPEAAPVNISRHPAPDWQPAWSPDGRRVAFASYRDDNWEIYVADVDGSNLTRLTEHAENDFGPSWAPDGRRLVFVSRRYADADLFVIDVETRALTQLTTGEWNEFEPAWSPDGAWIAFVTQIEDQGDIFVMRADGSEAVNVTQSPYANDFQPAWTPDSERLVYVTYTAAKGNHDLWSMQRDGSDAHALLEDARDDLAPNWRPASTISPASP